MLAATTPALITPPRRSSSLSGAACGFPNPATRMGKDSSTHNRSSLVAIVNPVGHARRHPPTLGIFILRPDSGAIRRTLLQKIFSKDSLPLANIPLKNKVTSLAVELSVTRLAIIQVSTIAKSTG